MESHKPLLFWDVFKNTVLWQQRKSSIKCNRPLPLTCQGKIFRHKLQFANSTRCQARSPGPVMGCLCWWLCARFPKCRTQTGIRLATALCWEDRMLPSSQPSASVQGLTRSRAICSHCCCHCHMAACNLCFRELSKRSMQKPQATLLIQQDVT